MNSNNSINSRNRKNIEQLQRQEAFFKARLQNNSKAFKRDMNFSNANVNRMTNVHKKQDIIINEVKDFEKFSKMLLNEDSIDLLDVEKKRKIITKLNSLIEDIYGSMTHDELGDSIKYFESVIAILNPNAQNGGGKETSKMKKDMGKKIREELSSHLDKKVVDRIMRQINKMNSL